MLGSWQERRRARKARNQFDDRWRAWWDAEGRRAVMRLLARHRCPTDAHYNGPHWPEAEGIGDLALYGGIDAEELAELLGDFAEDLEGAAPDAQRDRDAARAIVQYLEEHAPTPRSSTEG